MINDRTVAAPWFVESQPGARASLRLFCFPYAGGSSMTFRGWGELLPESVEVCPVQLPGRGARIREEPFTNLHSLVDAFLPAMAGHIERPFAFFGHSMGGAIAFELSRRLRREYGVEPRRLFISGRRAPHLRDGGRPIYNLPEPLFTEALRRLNGMPADILDDPEIMEMLAPLLRADISVSQTYSCDSRPSLTCPLTVYGGVRDTQDDPASLEAWREHTVGPFELKLFDGDHFFISTARRDLLAALASALVNL